MSHRCVTMGGPGTASTAPALADTYSSEGIDVSQPTEPHTGYQPWLTSDRADPRALPLADRHYNRQKIGSPQFVPPGRCLVLLTEQADALWVTSWPFAEFVRHAWGGGHGLLPIP